MDGGCQIRQYIHRHVLLNCDSQATATYTMSMKTIFVTSRHTTCYALYGNVWFLYLLQPTRDSGGVTKSFLEDQLMHWGGEVLRNVFVIFSATCIMIQQSHVVLCLTVSYAPAMLNMLNSCVYPSSWPTMRHASMMHVKRIRSRTRLPTTQYSDIHPNMCTHINA